MSVSAATPGRLEQDGDYIPRGTVTTTADFYIPPADGSLAFYYYKETPPGVPKTNFTWRSHPITVEDIRGREDQFTLDNNAFQAIKNVPLLKTDPSFTDEKNIKEYYYPEVEALIFRHVPGAKRIFIFNHTVRRNTPNAYRAPLNSVHFDQTDLGAENRVRNHLPDEAETLLKGRYRVINVWRPITGPIQDRPLFFGPGSLVRKEDVLFTENFYPDYVGKGAGVMLNEGRKWYYWSGMQTDEVMLLKCSDSRDDVPEQKCPHASFDDPRTPKGARPRESIEVRCLVFG
ncbi:hypothetical protein LOZ12_001701 [Ophidiomyces ophidiicola]|uniref:uncharacterized protein n=1 Tax=Ophidiomyces ophidiicola TaxID=1387563 RepID=UPI0020C29268|nr:uncharacterized protein LOZ57_005053 [Ophidiomyces ophidiicola]KAI1906561.1 hypothetical protein LOZ64_006219 [Ophidiomyces ophidiicola]KAI1943343.1 hypothetical protein LOZ57_005053 [Ophidiomyces ophidiicola]KAI1952986.1 hypothetical protein LOZ62_001253 [Ophidiomyces ophidiicola]KAI1962666.1 hypothetical protein LOZ59_002001 [Ophidiomyces ophidiicola]KAI1973504.1 hypothetical protein LOZ56_001768 [Ophidiomyces ophidiicola]